MPSPSRVSHPTWVTEAVATLPPLATIDETAALLRVSRRSIHRYLAAGTISAAHLGEAGPARVLIPRSSIADYLSRAAGAL